MATGSIRAYARHRAERGLDGRDPMAVEKAIQTGRIQRDEGGKIDFEQADRDWANNTVPHAPYIGSDEDGGGLSGQQYTRARAARELYQVRLLKLQYEREVGKLVSKEEMQTAAFNTYRQFREQILNIPDRIAALVAAESDPKKCHELLTAELRRAIGDFADRNAD
jgi:hypothetical protein